ncbi:nucleosome assembly protein 1-like 1 [Oppia nitens]|uniref:nucleosome assembly protein 1-like 1 n=1 Tax=Oppia nitens TaxID=1686743 RepID=UPI0023DC8FAA|nr:nucleosome assembly protein 1-like 1 [Oppia nitens]
MNSKAPDNQPTTSKSDDCLSVINDRVVALKKLQYERYQLDGRLAKEMFTITSHYSTSYEKIDKKIYDIISGQTDHNTTVTDNKRLNFITNSVNSLKKMFEDQQLLTTSATTTTSPVKGIPGFWIKAMKTVDHIHQWIEPRDEPVLQHLTDISIRFVDKLFKIDIIFKFEDNEYFGNPELTKTYFVSFEPNEDNPWQQHDGYYPIARHGCRIDWKTDRNITERQMKVKGVKNETSSVGNKSHIKLVSFFDIFDNQLLQRSPNDDIDVEEFLEDDWSLSRVLIKHFVPNAVLYLTGELHLHDKQLAKDMDAIDEMMTNYDD